MEIQDKLLTQHTKALSYMLGFITFILIVYILAALDSILIPVTIAIFLTYLFHPLVTELEKHKIPKWFTVIIILIVVSGVNYFIGVVFVAAFSDLPEKVASYSDNIKVFTNQLLQPFGMTAKEFMDLLNLKIRSYKAESIFEGLFQSGIIQYLFNSVTSLVGDFFIALIFWIFMIMGKNKFEERLKAAFVQRRDFIEKSLYSIDTQLQSYIIIKTVLSLATGVIATIIMMLFGVEFAIVWGILTFILNFIPNIGSLIATVFPIIMAILQFGFGWTTMSLAILLVVSHNIIGNLLEPHYLGRQMDLSPVFVLFSLIFWGSVWGVAGMFLAVPIAAAMKILFANIEPLKPLAILMGSKPPALVISGDANSGIIIKK